MIGRFHWMNGNKLTDNFDASDDEHLNQWISGKIDCNHGNCKKIMMHIAMMIGTYACRPASFNVLLIVLFNMDDGWYVYLVSRYQRRQL